MASFALDLVLWFTGVRGHIPRFDDFRPVPSAPPVGAGHLAGSSSVISMLERDGYKVRRVQ